jgi:hypothetical protein
VDGSPRGSSASAAGILCGRARVGIARNYLGAVLGSPVRNAACRTLDTSRPVHATFPMELRPLAIELWLGDVVAVSQPGEAGQAFAEHGRNDHAHNYSSVSVDLTTVEPPAHRLARGGIAHFR